MIVFKKWLAPVCGEEAEQNQTEVKQKYNPCIKLHFTKPRVINLLVDIKAKYPCSMLMLKGEAAGWTTEGKDEKNLPPIRSFPHSATEHRKGD